MPIVEPLRGRDRECDALETLLAEVRAGESRVLVLHGEAGVGKSALLEYLVERASGCRVTRAAGVQTEQELTYAGLHQFCSAFLSKIADLPGPQRDALATVFGLRNGDAPDRLLVGMAVTGLVSQAATQRPLVCTVDDAQWLDPASAQAMAFVARHVAGVPVGIVVATRDGEDQPLRPGLAELTVRGLSDADARALLKSAVAGPLDDRVRDRFVAESHGKPQALLELAHGWTSEELAGGFGLPATVLGPIDAGVRQRLASLTPSGQLLMLLAAAEPTGDVGLVWRAAADLGIAPEAATSAIDSGLVEFRGQVRFCHPQARSTVYQAASVTERQHVHDALARATDPRIDPGRRAWHHAHATPGVDEAVAAEVEHSAPSIRMRGGLPAVAAFYERAAELTPDPARRAQRALVAAHAKYESGATDAARRLLSMAATGPLDDLDGAQARLLQAQTTEGLHAPAAQLLAAGQRLQPLHPGLAREAYRDALLAALVAEPTAADGLLHQIAQAVRATPPTSSPHCDLVLDGVATLIVEGPDAGASMLQLALTMLREQSPTAADLPWYRLASRVCAHVWDDASWAAVSARTIEVARAEGAMAVLRDTLTSGAVGQVLAGDFPVAASLAAEAEALDRATGTSNTPPCGPMAIAAWRGKSAAVSTLISAGPAPHDGRWEAWSSWATAVVNNGLAHYETALAAAEKGSESGDPGPGRWCVVELVEAATRAGYPGQAMQALRRLLASTRGHETDWARGIEARSRALLSSDDDAERGYQEAISRLRRTRLRPDLARARLLYGEWLRRERRRVEARVQLRTAHALLSELGMEAFADRARHELLATGETVRKRTVHAGGELTAQEAQIARLARDGHTNPEISTQLFISPRTVEWHLRKVFTKLGINSRKELRVVLADSGQTAVQPA